MIRYLSNIHFYVGKMQCIIHICGGDYIDLTHYDNCSEYDNRNIHKYTYLSIYCLRFLSLCDLLL